MQLNNFLDGAFTLTVILKLFLLVTIIRVIELFFLYKQLSPKGFFSWSLLRSRKRIERSGIIRLLQSFINGSPFYIIQSLSAIFSMCILFYGQSYLTLPFVIFIFIANILSSIRLYLTKSGGDSLFNLLGLGLMFWLLNPTIIIEKATLIFLSVQLLLSYLVSGLYKLNSKDWIKGTAITNVLQMPEYGNDYIAEFLMRLGMPVNKIICYCIVVFQIAFPFSLLFSSDLFLIFLASGVLFHLLIAWLMGLNRFLLTFCSTYPALIYIKLNFFN